VRGEHAARIETLDFVGTPHPPREIKLAMPGEHTL
jgi:hypothetical protein